MERDRERERFQNELASSTESYITWYNHGITSHPRCHILLVGSTHSSIGWCKDVNTRHSGDLGGHLTVCVPQYQRYGGILEYWVQRGREERNRLWKNIGGQDGSEDRCSILGSLEVQNERSAPLAPWNLLKNIAILGLMLLPEASILTKKLDFVFNSLLRYSFSKQSFLFRNVLEMKWQLHLKSGIYIELTLTIF